MNKKQLATKLWAFCEEARTTSINVSEYKDVILGFIFYKYLSDNTIKYLKQRGWSNEDIKEDWKDSSNIQPDIITIKQNIGYFIEYKNLFQYWFDNLIDLKYSNVSDAIHVFNDKNINDEYRDVFENIFKSFTIVLEKLGKDNDERIKKIREIIKHVAEIPTDNINKTYDVLGYIYEFLIKKFNNESDKGGEFYTPNEISMIMSEVASHHLRGRSDISVYDPTCGSGSLLINIGESVRTKTNIDNITYFAQELREDTYNLSRMNLIMRGIKPQKINISNGDTLKKDWPFHKENENKPIQVDCVFANPPYSQNWDADSHKNDPRFEEYGIAPAKKRADYSFLLHCLYHLKHDGIMAIVMPHGVLFRGDQERNIRKNLIEKNNIETVIGLPSNIFTNTGIPTCIIFLKKNRTKDNSILFIDASKEFIKDGSINILEGSNIRKITDAIINRQDIDYFCRLVSKEEIINNDYNLNISKYISSDIPVADHDLYATIYGDIPNSEINDLERYWNEFIDIKTTMFEQVNKSYSKVKTTDVYELVDKSLSIKEFKENFELKFKHLKQFLIDLLIDNKVDDINETKNKIIEEIFNLSSQLNLIDKYKIYNLFDKEWSWISQDIEDVYQNGGFSYVNQYKEYSKKANGNDKKWQDGTIISAEFIKNNVYSDFTNEINQLINNIDDLEEKINETINGISDETKDLFYDSSKEKIDQKQLNELLKEIKDNNDEESKLIFSLSQYIKDKKSLNDNKNSMIKKLDQLSINKIKELTIDEIKLLLEKKWVDSVMDVILNYPDQIIDEFILKLDTLIEKYSNPINELDSRINKEEKELSSLLKELNSENEFDIKAINEMIKLLEGK